MPEDGRPRRHTGRGRSRGDRGTGQTTDCVTRGVVTTCDSRRVPAGLLGAQSIIIAVSCRWVFFFISARSRRRRRRRSPHGPVCTRVLYAPPPRRRHGAARYGGNDKTRRPSVRVARANAFIRLRAYTYTSRGRARRENNVYVVIK